MEEEEIDVEALYLDIKAMRLAELAKSHFAPYVPCEHNDGEDPATTCSLCMIAASVRALFKAGVTFTVTQGVTT